MRHFVSIVMLWLVCASSAVAVEPDPGRVLEEARELAARGKYEEALRKHLWFHEHALGIAPSYSGVRLSFALGDWVELGKKYPEARRALIAIRDRNTQWVHDGDGYFGLLHDIASINHYLGEEIKTVELFKTLHRKQPELARRWYDVVEDELVAHGEHKLCSGYVPDALRRFQSFKEDRERYLRMAEKDMPELKEYAEKTFLEATCRLIEILVAARRDEDAQDVQDRALAIRDEAVMRRAVERAMRGPAKPARPAKAAAATAPAEAEDKWAGLYASPKEIGGFAGTILELEKGLREDVMYRMRTYSDVVSPDDFKQDELRGRCLVDGDTMYLPEAHGFRMDGKLYLMASLQRYTLVEINGQRVLMRDDALRAYRAENKLYDYGILIRVSGETPVLELDKVERPSIKSLYADPSKPWHDPYVHGPNER